MTELVLAPVVTLPSPPEDTAFRDAKLRALAELAAGAGHEINNPVATISGYVQQLLAGEKDPDRIQALLTIGAQALRIRDMIGDLMLFARPPQPKPIELDLSQVTTEVIQKLTQEAVSRQIALEFAMGQSLTIRADPTQLRVLISALIQNGLEACVPGGRVVVKAEKNIIDGLPFARWTIEDDGRGMSPLELEHLFDPFFSGRQAGRGLGFGLAKAWRIAKLHHADIIAAPRLEHGTILTLIWPLVETTNE